MKSLRVSIRPIGNSQGVVVSKLLLAQAGLIAKDEPEALAMGAFGNEGDDERTW